jgi:hypothetical protein
MSSAKAASAASGDAGPSGSGSGSGNGNGGTKARSANLLHALSGGVAGALAKTCTAPLARMVILYQVQGFDAPATASAAGKAAAGAPAAGPVNLPFAAATASGPAGGALPAPATALGRTAAAAAARAAAAPPGLWEALVRVSRAEGVASLWKGNLVTIIHRVPYSAINFYTYEAASRQLAEWLPPGSDVTRRLGAGGTAGLVACTAVSWASRLGRLDMQLAVVLLHGALRDTPCASRHSIEG